MEKSNKRPIAAELFLQQCMLQREKLFEGYYESSKQYDAALLGLSSGALMLSISFITDIAKDLTPALINLLRFSWIMFIATIILVIISFRFSQQSFRTEIKLLNEMERGDLSNLDLKSASTKLTELCNWLSGIFFITALIATAVFAIYGVTIEAKSMTGTTLNQTTEPPNPPDEPFRKGTVPIRHIPDYPDDVPDDVPDHVPDHVPDPDLKPDNEDNLE